MRQSIRALALLPLLITLAGCLDLGPEGSNCRVEPELPSGSTNGISVAVKLPKVCPVLVDPNALPPAQEFSATFVVSQQRVSENDPHVYFELVTDAGNSLPIGTPRIPWVFSVNDLARAQTTQTLVIGSSGFRPRFPGGSCANNNCVFGEDRFYARTKFYPNDVQVESFVRLTYQATGVSAQIIGPSNPMPGTWVSLSASTQGATFTPTRFVWYRDGELIADGPQSINAFAPAAGVSNVFEVVIFGESGGQFTGNFTMTGSTAPPDCQDPHGCQPVRIVRPGAPTKGM